MQQEIENIDINPVRLPATILVEKKAEASVAVQPLL
jgi:hypothetical protein